MYDTKRTLQNAIEQVNNKFPVLIVTGPRQVGKTTLLKHAGGQERHYVTLDDPIERSMARQDPAGFLQRHPAPVLIDEVQCAPELFPYIKMAVDDGRQAGSYWLTSSQQFSLMKNVSESLAGRIVIMELQGFSQAEEYSFSERGIFLPEVSALQERVSTSKAFTLPDVYERICRGAFPFMAAHGLEEWERFYQSYLATYVQRDIRDYTAINDEDAFIKFLQVAAVRTGQLLNYTDLARDAAISVPTAKNWLSMLRAFGLVYLLPPYFNNRTKRLIKTPKLYFLDTGLCSYLAGWSNPTVLERGAMAGAMFETYVVSEIIKSYIHNAKKPRLFFFRDKDMKEVDLLIEHDGTLFPIEIKKTASPDRSMVKHFNLLQNLDMPIGHGAVVCLTQKLAPLTRDVDAVPVSLI